MKVVWKLFIVFFLTLLFSFMGCGGDNSGSGEKYIDISKDDQFNNVGQNYELYTVRLNENVNLEYTLDLGADTRDVFFVLTNTNPYSSSDPVNIANNNEVFPINLSSVFAPPSKIVAQRGKPEISKFNRSILGNLPTEFESAAMFSSFALPPMKDTAGSSTQTFKIDSYPSNDVPATCRKVVTDGTVTLNIWVADDSWEVGGTKGKLVTQAMVDELAGKFLQVGIDNDIYDWMTDIFSEEWGAHSDSRLINDDNEITILLFDIENDNLNFVSLGGVVGYFWAKDNFKSSIISSSNERIMFYLDSVMLAHNDGTWQITDSWPAIVVSTIAHEFQHLIHYYQKTVTYNLGSGSETWLDEMCSLVAEDLVNKKLADNGLVIDGPRGVAGNNPSAGSTNNNKGRLSTFNAYNDVSVTSWLRGNDSLKSYAVNYALGAFLIRNFSGSDLFTHIVQNGYDDYRAIDYALTQVSAGIDIKTLLGRWGAAVLLSDKVNIDNTVEYNNGNSWIDALNSYELGSINLFNYISTPKIYTSFSNTALNSFSNTYYFAGNDITGVNTWDIKIDKDTYLTVVVRDDLQ